MAKENPLKAQCFKELRVGDATYHYYSLAALNDPRIARLPYSIRVLLEAAVRNCDEFEVTRADVESVLDWERNAGKLEIPFKPARVLLQDFTGVPCVVDLAAMRDAMKRLGGDPARINPLVPVDLVIDHSVQVDYYGSPDAAEKNQEKEMERNAERFVFLKWGQKAFRNMLIVPPGSGIVHQVNLEYLARAVFASPEGGVLYPDSVVGTDSHTTMINGLGVVGWGVGGIEAEAVMLGQAVSMVLPEVVGYRLTGQLPATTTSTDLVLHVTEQLRRLGVVNKFVEFFGDGVAQLSLADRATLANMAPEYGATMGFFALDAVAVDYLRQTGRPPAVVARIEAYLKANMLWRAHGPADAEVRYSTVLELDLGTVQACLAGPKRPHDRVALRQMQADWRACLPAKLGFKGFGVAPERLAAAAALELGGARHRLAHGAVVIAAITSCTNTSNPSVMLGAGLLAQKALARGLRVPAYVKTSLSPGSGVVTRYLRDAGLEAPLAALGFALAGYGCMTCIGNSGELPEAVAAAVQAEDLVVAGVLSGNRNFEGRIHPLVRANYLASPPLVVAYALAGTVDIDFESQPLGAGPDGAPVFLRDVWPSRAEVAELAARVVLPGMFQEVYGSIQRGPARWQQLQAPDAALYPWAEQSTYIHNPPYFATLGAAPAPVADIAEAHCLLNLGDSITTDHISPAGDIARDSAAARYLQARGVAARDFNTYGTRRGNDEVMARGTFANTRIMNKLLGGKPSPRTLHVPSGETLDTFDAAQRYQAAGTPLVILAGADYGSGSSRDWAAKGPMLLGVKAVLAVSFERIHRSNLVGMGIVPLEFLPGQSADSLGLTGRERFSVALHGGRLRPGQTLEVRTDQGRAFSCKLRFDTEVELEYFRHGGILQYVLRRLLTPA